MNYEDLTPEQQAAIQAVLNIIRPSVGEMRHLVGIWKEALALHGATNSDWRTAINALAANAVIPNRTGLAGASSVTKAEIVNPTGGIIADMQAVVTTWEESARLALCVKLAGINAN